MKTRLEHELERFVAWRQESWQGEYTTPRELCEYGFVVEPREPVTLADKEIPLVLMGLTHGNEVAGVAILNSIVAWIRAGVIQPKIPIAFLLGNVEAARQGLRYLDRDLNRSFARDVTETREDRRARVLEGVLRRTSFIVDFHQTLRHADRSFFIFPYRPESFEFAREVLPEQTIVTHWGRPFSRDGRCSDEFVNGEGGIGITMETGQNGFDMRQVYTGVHAGVQAIRAVERALGHGTVDSRGLSFGDIFTWGEILPWPDGRYVELVPSLYNFKEVAGGETIGHVDGEPILASADGWVIFPKYLTRKQQEDLKQKPAELCRLMKRVEVEQLGQ